MVAQMAGWKAFQTAGCWVALMVVQMAGQRAFQMAGCWVDQRAAKTGCSMAGKKDQLIYLVFH
jgi:hypothetical protein